MTWKIEKKLLPIKAHFFLFNAALAGVIPILPVYAKQLGMSALSVGLIYTILPFVGLLAKPVFGAVADYFNKLKLLLIMFIIIIAISMLGINFTPKLMHLKNDIQFECNNERLNIVIDRKQTEETCNISCLPLESSYYMIDIYNKEQFYNYVRNNESRAFSINFTAFLLHEECTDFNETVLCQKHCSINFTDNDFPIADQALAFSLFIILVIIAWMSLSVSSSLSDAACYNNLQNRPELYGKQRLWGAVGWGASAALAGYFNNIFTTSNNYNFSPGFYILVIIFALDCLIVKTLDMENAKVSKTILHDVTQLLTKPKFLTFLFGVFAIGAFTGVYRSYLLWFIRSLDGSQLLLGLTSTVQCFGGEIPFFFLSGWLIDKIGHENVVITAFIAYGVRYLSYSCIYNPWWVLPLEIIHGPCFASFYSAMTSYAKTTASDGSEATMQGLLGGTFEGLGVATGSLLAGISFNKYSGRNVFFWTGVIAFVSGTFFVVGQRLIGKKKQ